MSYLCSLEKWNKIFICKMTNTPLNPYYIISCSIWCKILKEGKQEVLNNITKEWANNGVEMMKVQTNIKSARDATLNSGAEMIKVLTNIKSPDKYKSICKGYFIIPPPFPQSSPSSSPSLSPHSFVTPYSISYSSSELLSIRDSTLKSVMV